MSDKLFVEGAVTALEEYAKTKGFSTISARTLEEITLAYMARFKPPMLPTKDAPAPKDQSPRKTILRLVT